MKLRTMCPRCSRKHIDDSSSYQNGCALCDGSGTAYKQVSFVSLVQDAIGARHRAVYTAK